MKWRSAANRRALLNGGSILLLWELLGVGGLLNVSLIPRPTQIAASLGGLLLAGQIYLDLAYTLFRVLAGFTIGSTLGALMGVGFAISARRYRGIEPLIDFLRSIPGTSLFPLFLLLFGLGDSSKVALAAYASLLLCLFNTAQGVLSASSQRLKALLVLHPTAWQRVRYVTLPEALPQMFVGLRLAASASTIYVVVAEMFVGTMTGLGYRIYTANLQFEVPKMYAYIAFTGMVGYAVNRTLQAASERLVHWGGR